MKAMLSKRVGGPETLVLEELPDPKPGPGEVLLAIKACGVNYPDLLIIEDRYQFKPERPVRARRRGRRRRRGGGTGRHAIQAGRPRHRLVHCRRHGRKAGARGRPVHRHARRHAVRRGERAGADLRHHHLRPERPRQAEARRDAARAGCRRRRRRVGHRARQGLRRARHRRRVVGGEAGLRQEARRRRRRRLPARPLRQGRRQGAGRPLQEGLRRERRRRHLRPRGRRLFGSRAALHRLGGPPPGGGLPSRHPQAAAQPDAAQVLPGRRRVLGRLLAPRSQGQRRQHRRADGALRQGGDQAGGVRALSAVPGRAKRSPGWRREKPWARSS